MASEEQDPGLGAGTTGVLTVSPSSQGRRRGPHNYCKDRVPAQSH